MHRPVLASGVLAVLLLATAAGAPPASASDAAPVTRPVRTALPESLPLLRETVPAAPSGSWRPAGLLLSLAVGAGGWWMWRRRAGRPLVQRLAARDTSQAVVRLSSQALTPQASVHALQWHGEEFLVACTSQQVMLLSRTSAAARQETP